MKITISENIKNLRTQQHVTQEQLAEALQVSPQAVSRWENAATFPDISLLPIIANYFGVTTDYLLGVDIIHKQEKIDNVLLQNQKLRNEGKTSKSVSLLRESVKEYPNNSQLLYELANSLYSYYHQSGITLTEQCKRKFALESVKMCKKALKYSTDSIITDGCKQLLVFNYVNLKEYEKASEIADTLTRLACCREIIYPRTLRGKEALAEYQNNLLQFLEAIVMTLNKIRANNSYHDEQKLKIAIICEKLIITAVGENSCFFNDRLFDNTLVMARIYIKRGDRERTLECLERLFQYAYHYEERANLNLCSAFWISECKNNVNSCVKSTSQTYYDILLEFINNKNLEELLKGEKRFEAVMNALKAKIIS